MEGTKDMTMDSEGERKEEIEKLRRREAELIERIERLKTSMSRTSEIGTLVFKNNLMKEAQDELRRVQEKLSGFLGE
jgi:cell division protein FtsB